MSGRSRRLGGRTLLAGLAAAVTLALLSSCSGVSRSTSGAPVLRVVTGLYPLATAVEQIGGSKVEVTDVVPDGSNPRTYQATAADKSAIVAAGLVVEEGGGFQPSLEAAATGAAHVVSMSSSPPDGPYAWLDPASMHRYVARLETAMIQADPPAAPIFRAGAQAFEAEIDSTGIDYENTLSVCPHRSIFTPDRALSAMALAYGLQDVAVGTGAPNPDTLPTIASQVSSSGTGAVFAETWVDQRSVQALADAAGVKLSTIDTLTGAPAGGWPHQATYIQLLEVNLAALDRALSCGGSGPGQ